MSGGGGNIYDFGASQTLASIIAQQYQNYKGVYQPIENQQIGWATNPNTIGNAQLQAGGNAALASAAAATGLQKSLETSGVRLAPDQQAALQRKLGFQAGLSRVDTMNRAGQQTYDTISQVLSGGAPNVANLVASVGTGGPAGQGG